jgi:hypothetical protein
MLTVRILFLFLSKTVLAGVTIGLAAEEFEESFDGEKKVEALAAGMVEPKSGTIRNKDTTILNNLE